MSHLKEISHEKSHWPCFHVFITMFLKSSLTCIHCTYQISLIPYTMLIVRWEIGLLHRQHCLRQRLFSSICLISTQKMFRNIQTLSLTGDWVNIFIIPKNRRQRSRKVNNQRETATFSRQVTWKRCLPACVWNVKEKHEVRPPESHGCCPLWSPLPVACVTCPGCHF